MAGLLDFFGTPQGQGLLSAVAGGLAGARRGTPWNNAGRGLLSGAAGYGNALDRQQQEQQLGLLAKERSQMQEMRDLQMGQMRTEMEKQKGVENWWAGLPAVQAQTQPAYGAGEEGPTKTPGNPNALRDYALQANSPFAKEVMTQSFFPKPQESFTLSPGEVRFGPNGQVVAQGPAKPADAEDDAKIKQFKFAQARGYKGTFEQFVVLGPALMAAAAAPLRDAQVGNINAENAYNLPPPIPSTPRPAAGGATVSAGGKTYSFPNAAAAAAFKKQAGIQ